MGKTRYPAMTEWEVRPETIDLAMEAIDDKFFVSRAYHLPHLAGYSQDGQTIYLDHRLPDHFMPKSRGFTVKTDQYLVLHMAIEKFLEGMNLPYDFRRAIATSVERSAVEADGVDLAEYDDFMSFWADALEKEGYDDLPPDIDMSPYEDEGQMEAVAGKVGSVKELKELKELKKAA